MPLASQRRRRHARRPSFDLRSAHARISPGAMSERSAESDGLGRRAVRGAAVTSAGQGLRILIQLASVVIMARLLSPSDFGLFAMVMSIAGIAEVFRDFGLSQAAVQAPVLTEAPAEQPLLDQLGDRRDAGRGGVPLLVGDRGALRSGGARSARAARLRRLPAERTGDAVPGEPEPSVAVQITGDHRRRRCGGRARSRRQRGAGGRWPVGPRRPIARRLVRNARARGLLRWLATGAAATRGPRRRLHPLRMEHGRDADGDLRRQQRRFRRHRSEVRRGAARNLQPCVPARHEHREPVAGTDHPCRGADPLAAAGRGCEVLGIRARRPSGPRVHDRRGARVRHRRSACR